MSKDKAMAIAFKELLIQAMQIDFGSIDIRFVFHDGKLVRKIITKEESIKIEEES